MLGEYNRSQEDEFLRERVRDDVSTLRQYGDEWRYLADVLLSTSKENMYYRDSLDTSRVKGIKELNESIRRELSNWNFDYVVENSNVYDPKLDSETAYMLYETWHGERVRGNLKRFYTLDVRVFDKVIYPHIENKSGGSDVIDYSKFDKFCKKNIQRFENQSDIVIYLIDHGVPLEKIDLKNFYWLNKTVAKKIWYKYLLSHSYKNDLYKSYDEKKLKYIFKWLDEESLTEMLNEVTPNNVHNLGSIMQWFVLDKKAFHCIRNKYLECKEINYWSADVEEFKKAIIENIELFKWLDVEDAELLIKNGYGDIVVGHPEHFWLTKGSSSESNSQEWTRKNLTDNFIWDWKGKKLPENVIQELRWDRDKILNYIRNNLFERKKFNENVDEVRITLPEIWMFERLELKFFEWNSWLSAMDFRKDKRKVENSYSINEIVKIVKKINEFMNELWVNQDFHIIDNIDNPKERNKVIFWPWVVTLADIGLGDWYLLSDIVEYKGEKRTAALVSNEIRASANLSDGYVVLLKAW